MLAYILGIHPTVVRVAQDFGLSRACWKTIQSRLGVTRHSAPCRVSRCCYKHNAAGPRLTRDDGSRGFELDVDFSDVLFSGQALRVSFDSKASQASSSCFS